LGLPVVSLRRPKRGHVGLSPIARSRIWVPHHAPGVVSAVAPFCCFVLSPCHSSANSLPTSTKVRRQRLSNMLQPGLTGMNSSDGELPHLDRTTTPEVSRASSDSTVGPSWSNVLPQFFGQVSRSCAVCKSRDWQCEAISLFYRVFVSIGGIAQPMDPGAFSRGGKARTVRTACAMLFVPSGLVVNRGGGKSEFKRGRQFVLGQGHEKRLKRKPKAGRLTRGDLAQNIGLRGS
jgi:hypothetical protein